MTGPRRSRSLRVLETGVLTTVQDAGRPGLAHLGVPRSGWLDPTAARLANRLVGNPEGAALLECVLGGLVVEAPVAVTMAVTGADCSLRMGNRAAHHAAAISVPAGGVVALGPTTGGVRCYLAVAGGITVDPVLGSRSTDTLSGLGPPVVSSGTVLPVGRAVGGPSGVIATSRTERGGTVLRCTPGPRADWFTEGALETLTTTAYRVGSDSDRVGLRLAGHPLAREVPGELASEGVVLGAVQVPADGRPLVFLNDHPTTGGYPVVAVVEPADLGRCAQLRPGDEVSFRWV
jgi:biotin-dependent carboxylase-like uncharacterized protein